MFLREYLALGQGRYDGYLVLSVVRHPLDRMLGLYFWQGRWIRSRVPLGQTASLRVKSLTPHRALTKEWESRWDYDALLRLVARSSTLRDYLRLPDGSVRKPGSLLNPGDAERPLGELASLLAINPWGPLPVRNVTKPHEPRGSLRSSRDLAEAVMRAHLED